MHESWKAARARLAAAGIGADDAYFAPLIPLVDVAMADGEVQPEEAAQLEREARELVGRLNAEAGYAAFSVERALEVLMKLRRKAPFELAQLTAQVRALELEGEDAEAAFSRIVAGCLRVAMASQTMEGGELVHFCREERLRIYGILQSLAITRRYTPA